MLAKAIAMTPATMGKVGFVGSGFLAGLLLASLSGCDSFDASHHEFAATVQTAKPGGSAPEGFSKAYGEAASATVYDTDGNAYT
ncbi:MAG TPA: hypothetical protein VJB15_07640, partial [Rhodothermia bacterium]|nr:hypothetical protein [Rhodothermia bacterium]